MLFDPSVWFSNFMQLTYLAWDFKIFILVLGVGYLALAWSMEKYGLPRLARLIGSAKEKLSKTPKQRKLYKVIQQKMRV
jgi:cation-transporting ATPase 13A2